MWSSSSRLAAWHRRRDMHGVPVRKTPAIIEDWTGVRLTQGAITQDALKQTDGAVGATDQALRASVRQQPVVHTDARGFVPYRRREEWVRGLTRVESGVRTVAAGWFREHPISGKWHFTPSQA